MKNKIEVLQRVMKNKGIDYYIIPSEDDHQSEYVSDYYKGREYVSGFTGSAGTLLVTLNECILWTDGRYFIQAENQLKETGIKLFKMRVSGYPTLIEWLENNIKENQIIGFDSEVFSITTYKEFKKIADVNGARLFTNEDLLNDVWLDRPNISKEKAFLHDKKFAGKSAKEKIELIREKMKFLKSDNYIISGLDDIAWLLNIRGNDVKNNPVVNAYVILKTDECILYTLKEKFKEEDINFLAIQGIKILPYNQIYQDVKCLEGNILLNPSKINAKIYINIENIENIKEKNDITTDLKAIKNSVEVENMENSQIRDGIAMVKFIKWLYESIDKEIVTELSATDKLREFREQGRYFKGISFDTIAGYKEHAAMMHYCADKTSNYKLEKEGFFLLDSGGQYLDGTTDITRTFSLGAITDEQKRDFTLVLKGHINLMKAKFLKGTVGGNLDVLARKPLWDNGIDYKCGTGHGVGFYLNVHEGPQGINSVSKVPLEVGMVVTNEPGIYKEGRYGIRIENTMIVEEDIKNEFGEFYKFRCISYCPIDLNAIEIKMLDKEERDWLNNYHKIVFDKLSIFLNENEQKFLLKQTREV